MAGFVERGHTIGTCHGWPRFFATPELGDLSVRADIDCISGGAWGGGGGGGIYLIFVVVYALLGQVGRPLICWLIRYPRDGTGREPNVVVARIFSANSTVV